VARGRKPILAIGAVLLLGTLSVAAFEISGWVGQPFPGFLVLANRVVASAGLTAWPATASGDIYQSEIVEVDGRPVEDVSDIHAYVQAVPVGTVVRYRLHSGAESFERDIATRRFDGSDGLLLFGAYLLNGLAFGAMALLILYLRGDDRRSVGTATFFWIAAMFRSCSCNCCTSTGDGGFFCSSLKSSSITFSNEVESRPSNLTMW